MANPGYPRAHHLAETIRRTLGEWLERQPADRRLGLVTITDVQVTGDLRHAKVYVTVLDPELGAADAPEAAETAPRTRDSFRTLVAATPEARTWVAHNVRLRYAPTIEFLDDDVARQGARIDQLLAGLDLGDSDPPSPERPAHDRRP
jgi:ribosome-binding factor A